MYIAVRRTICNDPIKIDAIANLVKAILLGKAIFLSMSENVGRLLGA